MRLESLRRWYPLGLLLLPIGACGGTEVTQLAGPSGLRCVTELSGVPPSVASSSSQVTALLATERECSWTASSSASWLQISPGAGQGEASLTLTVAQNTSSSGRTATVFVNDTRASVTQAGAGGGQPVPPTGSNVSFDGSVSNLAGLCPVLAFRVSGRQVITDAATRFNGGSCTSLRNGDDVEIEGQQLTNGIVRATRVRRDDD